LADAALFARHAAGDRWFVDETYVKVNGVWRYIYRAVDQYGQIIDVLLTPRRDGAVARRFFTRALETLKVSPTEVVTDAAPVYPGVLDELLGSLRTRRRYLLRRTYRRDVHRTRPRDLTLAPMAGLSASARLVTPLPSSPGRATRLPDVDAAVVTG
jgi:transposase-like protein